MRLLKTYVYVSTYQSTRFVREEQIFAITVGIGTPIRSKASWLVVCMYVDTILYDSCMSMGHIPSIVGTYLLFPIEGRPSQTDLKINS